MIANFVGHGWIALMSLAFIPYYIKLLGVESYGLIGLFALLLTCFTFLDMGIAPTVNRELAKYTAGEYSLTYVHNLLYTFEKIVLGVMFFIMLFLYSSSDMIASEWLGTSSLSMVTISQSISLMGVVIGLRLVESLYRNAIIGLQKQIWLSAATALFATMRGFGAVVVLAYISTSIKAYFIWQMIVSMLSVVAFSIYLKNSIPKPILKAKFSKEILVKLRGFASSMMLISVLALFLTQIDKIVLSKMVSLKEFGYYAFAGTIAAGFFQLTSPISQAYYPLLTKLISNGDEEGVRSNYHNGAKVIAITLLPVGLMLIFFGENFIYLWTGNENLAKESYGILRLLVLGNVLNSLLQMPYMLQLANGATKWALSVSLTAMLVSVPATILAAMVYGTIGAAWVWTVINIGHIFISINLINEKIFISEKWSWYFKDTLTPIIIAVMMFTLFKLLYPFSDNTLINVIGYVILFLCVQLTLIWWFFRDAFIKMVSNFIKFNKSERPPFK